MITLLEKIFIKDKSNPTSFSSRQSYGILCGVVGIFFNVLLCTGKLIIGFISNSISITADALNNLSDAGSSVVSLVGFKISGQKPDKDHPFGHGRIEYISGMIISFLILLMGFELVKSSVSKIIHPEETLFSPVILVILLVSILVKIYMAMYNRKIAKKIDSPTMSATSIDSFSDALATTVVLISTLVSHYTSLSLDGYCGVLVGLFICFAGFNAAKETISPLLGQSPDPTFVSEINTLVTSTPGILGIHDLIVHNYGPGRMILSLHAEVPADGDILEFHDIIDNIEQEIRSRYNCVATIHMDPIQTKDPFTISLKEKVLTIVHSINSNLTIHDFRIVHGPTHTNILFDVVAPYSLDITDEDLLQQLVLDIAAIDETYHPVINIDRDYL